MTLQSSKLIRQQLTIHYQSKTHLTCVGQARLEEIMRINGGERID